MTGETQRGENEVRCALGDAQVEDAYSLLLSRSFADAREVCETLCAADDPRIAAEGLLVTGILVAMTEPPGREIDHLRQAERAFVMLGDHARAAEAGDMLATYMRQDLLL
ncbi:MAG: hypothetical protein ACR2M1_08975 [Gemmatimonadaceae bacterium]